MVSKVSFFVYSQDYWIESYWKDVIASEKAATGTSDVTFGSTDEQGTYSNSETGLDNGLEPNADPYAVHGAPRRLYDPYPEFRSYKVSEIYFYVRMMVVVTCTVSI